MKNNYKTEIHQMLQTSNRYEQKHHRATTIS